MMAIALRGGGEMSGLRASPGAKSPCPRGPLVADLARPARGRQGRGAGAGPGREKAREGQ